MQPETQNPTPQEAPLFPPWLSLAAAALGLILAAGVAFTQPTFNLLGWAGLAIAIVGLIVWGLSNPQAIRNILRGRAFTFGGTALVVAVVLMVALTALYAVIRAQGIRADLSSGGDFSLDDEAREVLTLLGKDPTTPTIKVVAFYGAAQSGERDRAAVLLDDFVRTSANKITYEFIDPDRNPTVAERYGASVGELIVVPLNDDGSEDDTRQQNLPSLSVRGLADAVISASATGNFRAYFVTVQDGVDSADTSAVGAASLVGELEQKYNWTVEAVSLADLTLDPEAAEGKTLLNDPAADGEVLVIPGGREALPDALLSLVTAYLDAGGQVVLFSDFNVEGQASLATATNLNEYLNRAWGFTINDDVVIDAQSALVDQLTGTLVGYAFGDFGTKSSPIVSGIQEGEAVTASVTRSVTVNQNLPANVAVTPLIRTSASAYSKVGVNLGQADNAALAQTAQDATGPFTVALSAENSTTGGRLVVFGSVDYLLNQWAAYGAAGIRNFSVAQNALFWAANYESFAAQLANIPPASDPADTPMFGTDTQVSTINFISVVGLPFGVLIVGVALWWLRRERDAERAA